MKFFSKAALLASLLAAAAAMAPVLADAHHFHHFRHFHHHHFHKSPKVTSSSDETRDHHSKALQWYVTGSIFCSSIFLIGHAVYINNTEHRQLTYREAYKDVAGCWLPIIGPLMVDQAPTP